MVAATAYGARAPRLAAQMLRAKCTEIMQEIGTLKSQIEQGQQDNKAYGQLERKYETLTNEMRSLQGAPARPIVVLERSTPPRAPRGKGAAGAIDARLLHGRASGSGGRRVRPPQRARPPVPQPALTPAPPTLRPSRACPAPASSRPPPWCGVAMIGAARFFLCTGQLADYNLLLDRTR
eukprot:927200-Prymnesium_polylepis.1